MKLNIPLDKQTHILAGYSITYTVGSTLGIGWGLLAGIVAGAGKEVYDKYFGGTPDRRDTFFTVVGSITAGGLLTILGVG